MVTPLNFTLHILLERNDVRKVSKELREIFKNYLHASIGIDRFPNLGFLWKTVTFSLKIIQKRKQMLRTLSE